jgi:hypothetical protein
MTDNIENIDLDSEEYATAPTGLRDHAKALKAQLAEARKQISAYQDAALGNVLTQAGFANPGRVRSAILADKVDLADQAKINEWIAANGNDFARGPVAPAEPPAPEQPDYSEQAAAQHQIQTLQTFGQPSGGRTAFEAAAAEITDRMTPDEVWAKFQQHGV